LGLHEKGRAIFGPALLKLEHCNHGADGPPNPSAHSELHLQAEYGFKTGVETSLTEVLIGADPFNLTDVGSIDTV